MKRLLLTISLTIGLSAGAAMAQQSTGTLKGQIVDELGGAIVGASVTVTDASGQVKTTTTNNEGLFVINGLETGKYKVAASAPGFAAYEDPAVEILGGRTQSLNITLKVTGCRAK